MWYREASEVGLTQVFPGLDFGGLKNEATCRGHALNHSSFTSVVKTAGKEPGLAAAEGDWAGWGSLFLVSLLVSPPCCQHKQNYRDG